MQSLSKKDSVVIPSVIRYFLLDLTDTLYEEEYFSYIENAEKLVNEILDFTYLIPRMPHYKLSSIAKRRFSRYGKELSYVFFKRKTSRHTTWFIFFSRQGDRYIIRYITNNHKDGKYIRNDVNEVEE